MASGKAVGLMSHLQLCLAHYCDIHGPTPLMVTEGHASPCSFCYEDANGTATSQSHPPSSVITNALRELSISRSASVPASEQEPKRASLLRSSTAGSGAGSVLETPPESPRPVFQQPRRDSSYRRTYDENVTKKQGPCDNCAMTLPRRQGSSQDLSSSAGGPTLRTKAPAERVLGVGGQASPPSSEASDDTDGEGESSRQARRRSLTPTSSSRNTSSSTNSRSSERQPFHLHYVDYTSTHEPVLPNSFSLLRASCLRALSFESLPRAPATTQGLSSSFTNAPPSFVTTQSAGTAATGGPIFFGDALAGFTTAYIFRIPDVHARGHKRVYAFLALSTHKERLAMRTFSIISSAFRELAIWVQQLAEIEADRVANPSPSTSVPYNGHTGGSGLSGHPSFPSQRQTPGGSSSSIAAVDRSESSFLTGGSGFTRRMGGASGASALKARGLAELVGQPDFFIELHRRFVQLLFEVGVTLSS